MRFAYSRAICIWVDPYKFSVRDKMDIFQAHSGFRFIQLFKHLHSCIHPHAHINTYRPRNACQRPGEVFASEVSGLLNIFPSSVRALRLGSTASPYTWVWINLKRAFPSIEARILFSHWKYLDCMCRKNSLISYTNKEPPFLFFLQLTKRSCSSRGITCRRATWSMLLISYKTSWTRLAKWLSESWEPSILLKYWKWKGKDK